MKIIYFRVLMKKFGKELVFMLKDDIIFMNVLDLVVFLVYIDLFWIFFFILVLNIFFVVSV